MSRFAGIASASAAEVHPSAQAVNSNSSPSTAAALTTTEYGSLYVVEQRDQPVQLWTGNLGYNYELSNPYVNLHGLSGGAQYGLGRYVSAGLQMTKYVGQPTPLANIMGTQLNSLGATQKILIPLASGLAVLTINPLSGHLNFFGNQPLEMELHATLGMGAVLYPGKQFESASSWSIRPSVHLSRKVSAEVGVGQEIENLFSSDRLFRLQGQAGLTFSL
ncbi:MAG: hypothetical protein H7222_12140 [Methylotenera sp.]|nr:hypothetical protein [Oligoflexia bacterium]